MNLRVIGRSGALGLRTTVAAVFLIFVAGIGPAAAQNYSFDARKIALGGIAAISRTSRRR